MLWRNAPTLLQIRLKFIFFSMVDMVTCDMESIYPNSTVLSASSRSVHLEYPSGGSLHASATTCASTSPVTLAGTGGVSRFFLLIVASSPFSQYELLTVCTVVGVVWYAFEISDTVMYVSLRLSEARRIFARNIVRAGLFPFVTMSVSFPILGTKLDYIFQ